MSRVAGAGPRAAVALTLLPAGLVVGGASVLLHRLPLGLLLACAAVVLSCWALPGGWWARLPFVVGWDAALLAGVLRRPGGGYLVAADLRGYTLLGVGLVVLLVAVATLRPWPGPDEAEGADDVDDADGPGGPDVPGPAGGGAPARSGSGEEVGPVGPAP